MTAKLKLVGGRNPALNYAPPQRINRAVPPAEWPFQATTKGYDKDGEPDVVISAIAPTETRRAKTAKQGLVRKDEGAGRRHRPKPPSVTPLRKAK